MCPPTATNFRYSDIVYNVSPGHKDSGAIGLITCVACNIFLYDPSSNKFNTSLM